MKREAIYLILFAVLFAAFICYAWTRPGDSLIEEIFLLHGLEEEIPLEQRTWDI